MRQRYHKFKFLFFFFFDDTSIIFVIFITNFNRNLRQFMEIEWLRIRVSFDNLIKWFLTFNSPFQCLQCEKEEELSKFIGQ